MKRDNIPELILPAGDLNKTKYAFMYGADSVYGGLASFSLRKAEVDFTLDTLDEAIEYAHKLNKKFYVTLNIFPKNSQVEVAKNQIKKIAKLHPDAFIISDPGLIQIAKKLAPEIRVHLSTQANSMNYETIKFWKSQGIKRVVLARELTLKEITEIKNKVPGIELECFVHGAMCISYSGRCLMSSIMTGREANQGLCTQPCRWQYKTVNSKQSVINNVYLEEQKRPGEYFPVEQDEKGTYVMNSKDLCLIEHLDELAKAGVSSFKIEGRNKSEYYVVVTARAYRNAITTISNKPASTDSSKQQTANKKNKLLKELRRELETINYRDYTTGFIFGKAFDGETYNDRAPIRKYNFVGVVKQVAINSQQLTKNNPHPVILDSIQDLKKIPDQVQNDRLYKIEIRNKIKMGDELEIITPTETIKFRIKDFYNLKNEKITEASPGNKNSFIFAELPKIPIGSLIRKKV